jgi:hypothetical protein
MASLQLAKVVVDWAGTMVRGAAASVLYFECPTGIVDLSAIRSPFATLALALPTGLTITFPTAGDLVDEFSGELVGGWTATSVTTVSGSGGTASAAGVGACATWQTGMVVSGRRLRGRTFLVPLASAAYDTDGTLTSTVQGYMATFCNQMNSIPTFCIWHRPTHTGTGPSRVNNNDGASRLVASGSVKDKVAILTSRRD